MIVRPILLVEDNPVDVDLMRRAFARRKVVAPIMVARDGEEALAYMPQWESGEVQLPVVILLDLKLPRVNGLEVLRQLKAHPDFRAIPVVVLTTSEEGRDIQQAYQAGANSYIVKPIDFDAFLDMTQQLEWYWCGLNTAPDEASAG